MAHRTGMLSDSIADSVTPNLCSVAWGAVQARARQRQTAYEVQEKCGFSRPTYDYQLYEGNFLQWMGHMRNFIDWNKPFLWQHLQNSMPPHITVTAPLSNVRKTWEQEDKMVIEILVEHVWPLFLHRLPEPSGDHWTACILVKHLETQSQPFRLMDLSRELRDKIYELCVVAGPVGPVHSCPAWGIKDYGTSLTLLNTSQQLRAEAGQIYFERNQFIITSACSEFDSVDPLA